MEERKRQKHEVPRLKTRKEWISSSKNGSSQKRKEL
jgi:hypothetical protein